VFPARLDVPPAPLDVLPLALPCRLLSAVGRLELAGLHHAEAPTRLRAEGHYQVAGLGHPVHDATVDRGRVTTTADLRGPLARVGVAHPLKSSDTALTALILGCLAPSAASSECVAELETAPRELSLSVD